MKRGRMYITLNRAREWKRSLLVNLQTRDNQLVFSDRQESEYGMLATGVLITGSIDSTEQDFQWESMRVDAHMPENSLLKVSCFASDTREVFLGDHPANLDEYIKDAKKNPSQGLKELSHLFKPAFSGSTDGLIRVKGRYLWLKLEFLVPQPQDFELRKIKLLLTDEKIIRYLPAIYRDTKEDNDFFYRFMEIFDSIFFDIEEIINQISEKMDYTIADGEMLRYLAGWVCLQYLKDLGDDELRERISGIMPEYAAIGTKPGLESFVERELGVRPTIIEFFNYKQMLHESRDREIYEELFGTNPYKFYLLLPEDALDRVQNINSFLKKLNDNIPAHTEVGIIRLKQGIILGKHTYLGVNSRVGRYTYGKVDENIEISFDTLIGGNGNEE